MRLRCPMAALCVICCSLLQVVGCAVPPDNVGAVAAAAGVSVREQTVRLPSGKVAFDVYLPVDARPAPLVVVAHGFSRSKTNMAGWGRRLASEGFVVAVPTLPAWSDHRRNGRAINELIDWLKTESSEAERIRGRPTGVMGFSAGGLSSLLAAADNPGIAVWIGLDPVDRNGWGVEAASRLRGAAVILRAEPSPWNADGNAAEIERALGSRARSTLIAGAIHIDAEWPTDRAAELVCGRSDDNKRAAFAEHAVGALKSVLRDGSRNSRPAAAEERQNRSEGSIGTERFILRHFVTEDWRDFQRLAIEWNAAPGPAFDKWRASEAACRESVEHMSSRDNYFALCLRASGEVVGLLAINRIDEQQQMEFGHVILSRYQDNDHDLEALRAFVQFCFADRGAVSIVTHNAPDHAAQLAPLKSLGFTNTNPADPGELGISQAQWARRP